MIREADGYARPKLIHSGLSDDVGFSGADQSAKSAPCAFSSGDANEAPLALVRECSTGIFCHRALAASAAHAAVEPFFIPCSPELIGLYFACCLHARSCQNFLLPSGMHRITQAKLVTCSIQPSTLSLRLRIPRLEGNPTRQATPKPITLEHKILETCKS